MQTSPEIGGPLTVPAGRSPEFSVDAGGPAEADDHGRAGWAWALPVGPGCAREARAVLGQALGALGAPANLIADAQLMVSELATNAYQHADGKGPYELWLYPDAGSARYRPHGRELRCAVFDGLPDVHLPGYSWTSGDFGRGLSIVRELSGGRWGVHRERSRLDGRRLGKIVWFALPSASCPGAR
ncbi:ATP-binding protein [Thermomonospora catenispora]|uniref:ATP-binding protein n=1 Tax=Thermomonospora catenispora TaxID=2493090 RepID=UPI00111F1E32|nr:ATP-binding protein [Thermomonospora catenispora]TNY36811.1 ATP-binding protein [Thermomonospora catenispora]